MSNKVLSFSIQDFYQKNFRFSQLFNVVETLILYSSGGSQLPVENGSNLKMTKWPRGPTKAFLVDLQNGFLHLGFLQK